MSLLCYSKPAGSMRVLSEYVFERDVGEKGFRQSVISMYEHNAKWSNPFMRFLVHAVGVFFLPRPRSLRYIFWGVRFEELILSLPRSETCVVGGPKQLIFCLKNRLAFLPAMDIWLPLLRDVKGEASESNDQEILSCLSKLANRLSHVITPDAVLVVDNDSLPAQRAVIQAARSAHIDQVICIQHGVFQRRSPGHVLDGWFSDRFFVIDDNQKGLLVEKGMSAEKISVMGFHSSPYLPQRPISAPLRRKVCLVGQPWGKYGKVRGERYLLILKKLYDSLLRAGFQVFFKPHPWERGSAYLKEIPGVVDLSMTEALETYDVFVSLTSTALLEATASGRIAVQVVDPVFDADRFSDFSNVVSIDFDDTLFDRRIQLAVQSGGEFPVAQSKPLVQRFTEALTEPLNG